ncbi:unnamed protein product [Coregonus sp. 'balchen']|nr:unnamed protein product [Coregonus sp. 'balchen']
MSRPDGGCGVKRMPRATRLPSHLPHGRPVDTSPGSPSVQRFDSSRLRLRMEDHRSCFRDSSSHSHCNKVSRTEPGAGDRPSSTPPLRGPTRHPRPNTCLVRRRPCLTHPWLDLRMNPRRPRVG